MNPRHDFELNSEHLKFSILISLAAFVFAFPLQAQKRQATTNLIDFPTDAAFLPAKWREAPIQAEVTLLDTALTDPAKLIIQQALQKYPEAILADYLKSVSIVGSLRFYKVNYGGTYMANSKRIVLVYRKSFDPRGFEQRLHHEFSSILLKLNEESFENSRWIASNEPDFVYRAGGVIEKQTGDRSEATKVLAAEQKKTGGSGSSLLSLNAAFMEEGFLTQYNRVSVEQDLNETAAHLFTNPEIWSFCRRYPRLDQKIDVLIDFYRKLDPEMDRLYFRDLTRAKDPVAQPKPQKK